MIILDGMKRRDRGGALGRSASASGCGFFFGWCHLSWSSWRIEGLKGHSIAVDVDVDDFVVVLVVKSRDADAVAGARGWSESEWCTFIGGIDC